MHDLKRAVAAMLSFLACALLLNSAGAADDLPRDLKCVVCGQAADGEHTADWRGGKVYLACPKCVAAFRDDSDRYAVKANAQLVATGQARQVACPITGEKVSPGRLANVGGVEIGFCCVGCQGRVARAKGDVRLYLVFGKNAFEKGFELASRKPPAPSKTVDREPAGADEDDDLPKDLAPFFAPPEEYAGDYGDYRSPLKFYDGREVKTAEDWRGHD